LILVLAIEGFTMTIILSHFQAQVLLEARQAGRTTISVSPDLGLTTIEVAIEPKHILFPDSTHLSWAFIAEIHENKNTCFTLENGDLQKVQAFSEFTNRFCSLMPTESAPTLLIAGFPMHRIKDTDPYRDTQAKIRSIKPIIGNVLDTTTGLGYTAIEASRTAQQVITIELDPAVLEIARLNPWSKALFDNPAITQRRSDSFEEIRCFENGAFTRIIHDPPTISLGGDLYSGEFYRELFRVLARGGRLYHYIGDLDSKLGHRVAKGAVRRLQEAGFTKARPIPQAFGLVAYK
jgi:predicted methyltransferase